MSGYVYMCVLLSVCVCVSLLNRVVLYLIYILSYFFLDNSTLVYVFLILSFLIFFSFLIQLLLIIVIVVVCISND